MSKYDAQLGELKNKIASAQAISIVLPSQIIADKLAAGLALFLSLEQSGKPVTIVSEGTVLVAHATLYGVGKITDKLPQAGSGNFTLTLQGVVAPDGTVPSLEKLDWFPEGQDLNLVFHVLPGQTFNPANIVPKYQSSSTGLIFVIGASSLNELGGIYNQNQSTFSSSYIVNIDNNPANAQFGKLNISDPAASSVSEMVGQIINSLGLATNSDIASNLLAGIYSATNNLTAGMAPDTFITVGQAMQAGGKIPAPATGQPMQPAQAPSFDYNQFIQPQPAASPQPVQSIPPISQSAPVSPSFQETPMVEQATTTTTESSQPTADWLTPKVYKGTSLG